MSLANRVRTLRRQKNLTQHDLGQLAGGIPYQSIQNLEAGKVKNPRYILELAKVLEVSTDYLLKGVSSTNEQSAALTDGLTLAAVNAKIENIESKRFYLVSVKQSQTLALSGDANIEAEVVDIFERTK